MTESKPVKKPAKKAPAKKVPEKKAPAKKAVEKETEKKSLGTSAVANPKSESNSFENESVSVQTHFSKGCQAKMEVQVKKKVLEESYLQSVKEVSKNISVPGFRKGKVPRELIEKNYKSYIDEQYEQVFVQKSVEHALNLTKIRPLNYREIKPKVISKSETKAEVHFSFETYPVVPEIDIDKLKLQKIKPEEVDQEKIDEVIDVMRSYKAKWERVKDRGVKKDDFVELDIINTENNTKLVSKKRVQVKKGRLSNWIIKLVTGMKKDESKEATSEWDSSMPVSEKKDFKPTPCKVTVLDILTAELPEIDEDFAKAMGTQSIADLRTQVLMRLNKNAEEVADAKQKESLDEQLEKLVDFDLPNTLVAAEKKVKIQMKEQELKQANFSDEDIKKNKKENEEEAAVAAVRSLKLFFILQKLAQDNGIIVTEHEMQTVLAERVNQLNLPAEFKSSPQFKNQILQEMRMNCFVDILSDKVKRYLLKKVTYA